MEKLNEAEYNRMCFAVLAADEMNTKLQAKVRELEAQNHSLRAIAQSWERGHDYAWEQKQLAESRCKELEAAIKSVGEMADEDLKAIQFAKEVIAIHKGNVKRIQELEAELNTVNSTLDRWREGRNV